MNQPAPHAFRLPYAFAKANGIILGASEDSSIEVFVRDDAAVSAIAETRRLLGQKLRLVPCDAARFEQQLAEAYSRADQTAAEVADDIGQEMDLTRLVQELPPIEDLLESEDDAPIIRMINALLTQAAREQASDIHIEPFETSSVVRFRVDGTLRDVVRPKKALHGALISRIKIMAQLDIAEKRLPQDGRITLRVGGRPVDVRVST
ncbi:MAG: GspE/PulE family protein, partial [Nevskiales bacterium]